MDNELEIIDGVAIKLKGKTCPTSLVIPKNVTKIAPEAFANCVDLEEVVLPDSLLSIGKFAFFNCKKLKSVTFSPGIKMIGRSAFQNCEALEKVELFYGIGTIEPWTFAGCKSLEEVSLPNGVKNIGHQAFADCVKLKRFDTLSSELCYEDALGYDVFQNMNAECKVTVPLYFDKEYQQMPQWNAFDIKVNEKRIFSFNGLRYREVEEGKMVAVTENKSFVGHADIKSEIQFGNLTLTVCEIDACAFRENNRLTSVHIPQSVKKIGGEAFANCANLEYFTCDAVTDSEFVAVNGVLFNKMQDTIVAYPAGNDRTVYYIPSTVMSINDHAFSSIHSLERLFFLNPNCKMHQTNAFDGDNTKVAYAVVPKDASNNLKVSLKKAGFLVEINEEVFNVDGINYKILTEGEKEGERTVEVSTNAAFVGDLIIPGTVDYAGAQYHVVGIGDNAFDQNEKVTSVSFPDSNKIKSVGVCAFRALKVPMSLPTSLETIAASAFASNVFEDLSLPSELKEVCHAAFGLATVKSRKAFVPKNVEVIEGNPFLGSDIKIIEVDTKNKAFKAEKGVLFDKKGQKLIAYPKLMTDDSYTIPNVVKTIGKGAFAYNNSLTKLIIPATVETLEEAAFESCSSLVIIEVNRENPPAVGTRSFNGVKESCFVVVPKGKNNADEFVDKYKKAPGWDVFADRIVEDIPTSFPVGDINYHILTNANTKTVEVDESPNAKGPVTIPKEVEFCKVSYKVVGIGAKAFWNNKAVTSLTLPDTITDIHELAFGGATISKIEVDAKNKSFCVYNNALFDIKKTKLIYYISGVSLCVEYKVPEGVTEIGSSAFQEAKITHLHLPSTLTTFGSTPFGDKKHGNQDIKVVSIDAKIAPKVKESDAFSCMNTNCVFVVLKGCKNEYRDKGGWKEFADRIFEPTFQVRNINYEVTSFAEKTVKIIESPDVLDKITIENQVEYYGLSFTVNAMDGNAFFRSKISDIAVSGNNKYFISKEGVLFSVDGKKLIAYPSQKGRKYTIPSDVTTIGESAFFTCLITKLTIECKEPPVVGENGLAGLLETCSEVTVPKGCAEKYKSKDGWKDLMSKNIKIKEQEK